MSIAPVTGPTDAIAPCADMTRAAGDSPAGTGTSFASFLLLDHRLPWSRTAADDAVRELLDDAAAGLVGDLRSLRVFAVRPVTDRRTAPLHPARAGRVGDAPAMTRLAGRPTPADLRAIAALDPPGIPVDGPLIGVCTNAKRDRCCAVRGGPVARRLHAEFGDRITEISHLGGHRYAATMLVLPTGYSYGFLDDEAARDVVRAAMDGLVHPHHLRGRADLDAPAQAADAHWRRGIGAAPLDAVRIQSVTDEATGRDDAAVLVRAVVQGTGDAVRLRYIAGPDITETACGGKPIHTGRWVVAGAG